MIDPQLMIEQLGANGERFRLILKNLSDDQARWKPATDRWSLLEVINHLLDEEREDFRRRLTLVLNNPEESWPPIDPEGWVFQRDYNRKDLSKSLRDFFEEREKSINWLRKLDSPNWQATHRHPKMGPMSAETLLVNWVAHDLFHIRQVTDLQFAYLKRTVAPVSLDYSGWE